MSTFSVIVSTYGDKDIWVPQAAEAADSAYGQGALHVVMSHGDTLAAARNTGAEYPSNSDYLIFLDADDRLSPGYVEAMNQGTAVLRQPATIGWYGSDIYDDLPMNLAPKQSIRQGNWFVIGTAIPRKMFLDAGGFWEEPAWEDWSLMLRCFALGATWEPITEAVYIVGINEGSRNTKAANDASLLSRLLITNDTWAAERGLVIS